jgi:hypothetical protein
MAHQETTRDGVALPPMRLRIGVTGHRGAPKLPDDAIGPVRACVNRVISAVMEAARGLDDEFTRGFPHGAKHTERSAGEARNRPSFTIVSALAEGADRIIAEAGLAAGFTLEAVLPFARAEYRKDFGTPESCSRFDELIAQSESVFELDGNARERPRAYEAAGLVMLANVDVLIAVWDGEDAAGIGGTAQIVARAVADGIPIVWIDPAKTEEVRLSWLRPGEAPLANAGARPKATFHMADAAAITQAITDVFSPPTQSQQKKALQLYLSERERRWNLCPWFPLLQWVFAGRRLRRTDFCLPSPLAEMKKQWQPYFTILPQDGKQRPAIENALLSAYSVADHLAIYYSLVYRSAYVFNFLFAAIAVTLALGGVFHPDLKIKSVLVGAELVVIGTILFTWLYGHHRQWHRRWLDYRRLAECLRHMRVLAPIGASGPIDRSGRNLDVDEQDWVNWYAWSLRRLIPLPNLAVDVAYVTAMRDAVRATEIDGQLRFHLANAERIDKLDHRMHRCGQYLFGFTGGLCLLFLCVSIPLVWSGTEHLETHTILDLFTFVTALFPTLGAAISAIHVQGDFKTVAEQSKRTAERLGAIDKILEQEPPEFARLTDRIEKTADVMMADLLEWQTVFRTRPLSLPA